MSADVDYEQLLNEDFEKCDPSNLSVATEDAAKPCQHQADLLSALPPIMPLSDVRPYDFSNKLSSQAGWKIPSFLAERCVAIGKDNVKIKVDGVWKTQPRKQAIATLFQNYGLKLTYLDIDLGMIKTFMQEGIQHIDGEGIFPGCAEFVLFENQIFLNTWKDLRLSPVTTNIREAETILRIIRENLCDLPPASLKEMVEEIKGEEPTVFRWVMHWLAAVYQRPGYHIGTALWFVGRRGGVGKGTLLQILSQLWANAMSASSMRMRWEGAGPPSPADC